jgi:hypothetical protein
MFYRSEFAVLHLGALGLSLLLLISAWRRPRVGRLLYVALFAWACAVNWYTVLERPLVYLDYAPAVLESYSYFIRSWFADHVTLLVGAIATSQGLIALSLVVGGTWARLGTVGAIIFLVAIAPLGVGSGFPSTLVLAGGALLLLRDQSLSASLPRYLIDGWRGWHGAAA